MRTRGRWEMVRAWLALGLWTALVWQLSSDDFSAVSTLRILTRLLHWLFPDPDREHLLLVHFLVRKGAHLAVYGVLGWLALRAVRVSSRQGGLGFWGQAGAALLLVAGIASTDEIHQKGSRVRAGSPLDVGIDVTGGAAGIAFASLARRRSRDAEPTPLASVSAAGGPPDCS